MLVEIWSDVVCPWCAIGKRRFEQALDGFAHRDEVEVVFRSFELDPRAPERRSGTPAEQIAKKYGMTVEQARTSQDHLAEVAALDGLTMRYDRVQSGNTFDAHRLLHLAAERGCQAQVKGALMERFFADGLAIGVTDELAEAAVTAGLDATEVAEVLAGDRFAEAVRADEARAQELGVTGVPFFLIDGKFAIPGAQSVERFGLGLDRAWEKGASGAEAPVDSGA
jgi:predicted DsbA family dithiol-disulfide isomerase